MMATCADSCCLAYSHKTSERRHFIQLSPGRRSQLKMTTTNKSCCPYQRLLPPKPTSHLDAFCLFVSATSHSLSPPKKLFALRTHTHPSQSSFLFVTDKHFQEEENK
jgi:hypothetical protein